MTTQTSTGRVDRHRWCLEKARLVSQRSTCLRRAVGCILVNRRGHELASGYNGVAAGLPHCNHPGPKSREPVWNPYASQKPTYPFACSGAWSASGTNLEACEAIHAEQNALLQCKDVWEIEAAYITTEPCVTCVKLLLNTSCQAIISGSRYSQGKAARTLWERAGRVWHVMEDA